MNVDPFCGLDRALLFGHLSEFEGKDKLVNGDLSVGVAGVLLQDTCQEALREKECRHPERVDCALGKP